MNQDQNKNVSEQVGTNTQQTPVQTQVPNAALTQTPTPPQQGVEGTNVEQSSKIPEEKVSFNGADEVILQIKPKKEKGSFGIVVLFVLLIAFIFFLPELSPYIDKYLGRDNTTNQHPEEEEPQPEEPTDPTEEKKYYNLADNPTISIDDLSFSNLSLDTDESGNLIFSVKLTNKGKNDFDYSTKYFIELYSEEEEEKTLLNRIMVYNDKILTSSNSTILKLNAKVDAIGATQVLITQLSEQDYPPFEIEDSTLTCVFGNQSLEYTFNGDKLTSILDTNVIYRSQFATEEEYLAAKNSYDNITEYIDRFEVNKSIDLAVETNIDDYKYFKNNENIKVVNFEMEASGYNCN